MVTYTKCLTAISVVVLLVSCNKQPANEPRVDGEESKTAVVQSENTPKNQALLDAAEEFETLTESSFSADFAAREIMIARANKVTANVWKFASPDLTARLQTYLANITTAQKNNASADLAIASIEVYRELVSAISGDQKIPVNVSLLDYAGFRVDADAQAKPARFSDMKQAVIFAQQQWAGIKSRSEIADISARFSSALTDLEKAVESGDPATARAAAKVELDMVDELETAFGK